jgi:protocatechuate 3,4-dioxygenase beta subunit
MTHRFGRREFLGASAVLLLSRVERAHAQGGGPRPTPACGEHGVTHPQTPGPYFKPQSPPRASLLEPGMPGPRIVVEGTVLGRDCKPVPRALLDFWQADAGGRYDNAGFRLRGHQFTDAEGRYRLETILPGVYPGRTRHIHVKAQAPSRPALTTQMYFPGEPINARDGLFDPALLVALADAADGATARFDVVLALR